MSTRVYAPDEVELLAAIGESALAWNVLESTVRLVMYKLGGGHNAVDVLTSGMNASPLASAFEVMINEFAPGQLRKHLLHSQKIFGRLRENRNEFTHGPMYLARDPEGKALIFSQAISAKSRLKIYQGDLKVEDIRGFTAEVTAAQFYLGQLAAHLWGVPSDAKVTPLNELEQPKLPDKLLKVGHYMLQHDL